MAKMIGLLDDRSRRIVRMIGIEGARTTEVGQTIRMNEAAVRVALHPAFKTLTAFREWHLK